MESFYKDVTTGMMLSTPKSLTMVYNPNVSDAAGFNFVPLYQDVEKYQRAAYPELASRNIRLDYAIFNFSQAPLLDTDHYWTFTLFREGSGGTQSLLDAIGTGRIGTYQAVGCAAGDKQQLVMPLNISISYSETRTLFLSLELHSASGETLRLDLDPVQIVYRIIADN